MEIEDFGGVHKANSDTEIDALLATRHEHGVDEFWLSHENLTYPAIAIMANKDLACVHYFPGDDHPGFQSAGPAPGLNPEGKTRFASNIPDEISTMLNRTVVPFSWALAVAKEFARSAKLPRCIEWFEL